MPNIILRKNPATFLPDGYVTSDKISNGAVLNSKLYDECVTADKIADEAIEEAKIAADAVTEAKIAAEAITEAKIAADAITTEKIANAAITASLIGDAYKILEVLDELPEAGTASRIVYLTTDNKIYRDNGTVWKELILPSEIYKHIGGEGASQIATAQIEDSAIEAAKIASNAIEEAKIAADAVTAAKINVAGLDGETGNISANHIIASMLQTNCVTSVKIQADAVIASKINVVGLDGETGRIVVVDVTDANEVTDGINTYATTLIQAGKVLISGEVNLDDWSHGTDATLIDGGKIYTGSITATQMAADSINTDELVAGSVTVDILAANAVIAEKIATDAVVADKIQADAVTAVKILAGAIATNKLAADSVTAPKINVVGLDGETGRICVVGQTDADEITGGINAHALTLIEAGKILISGETDLSDWRHGVDATFIDGGKIYTQSITATQILAGTITADEIAALAIETGHLAANCVTAAKIAAGTITADKIAVGAIPAFGQLWGSSYWTSYQHPAGGSLQSWNAGNVNDGLLAGYCFHTDAAAATSYVRLDVGEGVTKGFTTVAVYMSTGVNAIWSVQYSDDASEWTTVAAGIGGHPTTQAKHHYGVWPYAGVHRYWQLVKTDAAVGGDYHREIQFYEGTPIGAIVADWAHASDVTLIDGGKIYAKSITADEIFAGTITADELVIGQRVHWYSLISGTTRNSNDAEKSTSSTSWIKIKETKLNEATGEMNIYFELKSSIGAIWVWARVYKNGVPIGLERATISGTYVAHNEDLGPFDEGDLIQIYAKATDPVTSLVRYLRFRYDRAVTVVAGVELETPLATSATEHEDFSMNHQDP